MYRTVHDLNKAELDELRDALFWGDDGDDLPPEITYPWEIPDSVLFERFSGVSFVDEDFSV